MLSQTINRRHLCEYLVELYKFYENYYDVLEYNNDFKKFMETQEKRAAELFKQMID